MNRIVLCGVELLWLQAIIDSTLTAVPQAERVHEPIQTGALPTELVGRGRGTRGASGGARGSPEKTRDKWERRNMKKKRC
jgi:hypothetical protein